MDGLEQDRQEPASHLRRRQDAELAMEHVVKGVTEMKSGNRVTAIQQFNQALTIDPLCVDALVARGAALYQACMCRYSNRKLVDSITLCVPPRLSNEGHFTEAEADFDQALTIQRDHQNARNYMVETLISYAGLLEVQGEVEQARAKYEKVLMIKEERRAKAGLEKLNKKKEVLQLKLVCESKKQRKSLEEMKKEQVRDELRSVFRSRSRQSIREVVFCFGTSPARFTQVYRIPISVCSSIDSMDDACGSRCGEISDVEKRRINLNLFQKFPPEEARYHDLRMFVFLHAIDSMVSENIEER
uniref:TPR_REGION domain-containing protein n=1 Tax=Heterorhabditis bacteriophora TaxID=37862 RepID=A0A1I7WIT5_HETBA